MKKKLSRDTKRLTGINRRYKGSVHLPVKHLGNTHLISDWDNDKGKV